MITVAETTPFQRKSATLLSSKEKDGLIGYLAEHPSAGDLIQGTGGVRKIKWARGGRGKSSGVRVIYYYHNETMPLYLLTIFGKNEKSNISTEEKHFLSDLVRELIVSWRVRNEQGIH